MNGIEANPGELEEWIFTPDKSNDIQKKIRRDFFTHPDGDYWQRVSAEVLIPEGKEVKWNPAYNMLDGSRTPILK